MFRFQAYACMYVVFSLTCFGLYIYEGLVSKWNDIDCVMVRTFGDIDYLCVKGIKRSKINMAKFQIWDSHVYVHMWANTFFKSEYEEYESRWLMFGYDGFFMLN